jgi:hypothetical protein
MEITDKPSLPKRAKTTAITPLHRTPIAIMRLCLLEEWLMLRKTPYRDRQIVAVFLQIPNALVFISINLPDYLYHV